MAEDYQHNGRCPRCGQPAQRYKENSYDTDGKVVLTIGHWQCADQESCGWAE